MGEIGIRKLAFQNIGFIEAKVILEIYDDPQFLFSLESFSNSIDDIKNIHSFGFHVKGKKNLFGQIV